MTKTSERIRKARLGYGLTVRQVAELTGLTEKTISRYENGQSVPDSHGLIQLSCIFDLSVDYLLGLSDDARVTFTEEHRNKNVEYRRVQSNLILRGKVYYAIEFSPDYEDIPMRGLMQWCGKSPDGELYRLRPIDPHIYISLLQRIGRGLPLILNCLDDYYVFLIYGGKALITEELSRQCVPYLLRPGTVRT